MYDISQGDFLYEQLDFLEEFLSRPVVDHVAHDLCIVIVIVALWAEKEDLYQLFLFQQLNLVEGGYRPNFHFFLDDFSGAGHAGLVCLEFVTDAHK